MSDLELALDRHQIHQLYQPIVNAQAELVGAEVLMRWDKDNELIPQGVYSACRRVSANSSTMGLEPGGIDQAIKSMEVTRSSSQTCHELFRGAG